MHTGHSISTSPCLLEILSSSANSPMIQLGTLAIWPQAVCFPAQPGQEPGDRPAQDPGDICTVPGAAAHPPADGGHPQTAG